MLNKYGLKTVRGFVKFNKLYANGVEYKLSNWFVPIGDVQFGFYLIFDYGDDWFKVIRKFVVNSCSEKDVDANKLSSETVARADTEDPPFSQNF